MIYCIYITTILLLSATLSFGQVVERFDNETPEQFITRFQPENSISPENVIVTIWNTTPVIIAFYDQTYTLDSNKTHREEYHRIIAVAFMQERTNSYRKILIDIIENEGGTPHIDTVFFANADKDIQKELILIVSWPVRHYDVNGTLYETFIYNDLPSNTQTTPKYLQYISEKLSGGCNCNWRDGTHKKAKFKTAADVKRGLKRLRYKQ